MRQRGGSRYGQKKTGRKQSPEAETDLASSLPEVDVAGNVVVLAVNKERYGADELDSGWLGCGCGGTRGDRSPGSGSGSM